MEVFETAYLNSQQKEMIYRLWNQEYPKKLNYKNLTDLDNYLNSLNETNHFLLDDFGEIKGWAFTFQRDNEKWFAIIVHGKIHGQGKGTLLLNKLKEKEEKLNGWVIDHDNEIKQNGEPYKSPLNFYKKKGFTIFPEIRLETETLSAIRIKWKQK